MRNLINLLLILFAGIIHASAQYISEIYEYTLAPGQFINAAPAGIPYAANTLIGGVNGFVNLGSFGGYLVFGFEEAVENHPDNPYGIDFTIFGNPLNNWSEPAIVSVMKDENRNNIPDDTWYELAGSDYYFSSTKKDYTITYFNPGDTVALDVQWLDSQGNQGYIFANDFHNQSYYPDPDSFHTIDPIQYNLTGTCIEAVLDLSEPAMMQSEHRGFGYADNHPRGKAPWTIPDNPYTPEIENSGGDAFDISWAVDAEGNYIDIDSVHFIKVHNAVLEKAGWLGELSPEITGAADVEPDNSIYGDRGMIIVRDLPDTLREDEWQLEVFYFWDGRLQKDKGIDWEVDMPEASITSAHLLKVNQSGDLKITAHLAEDPGIQATVESKVMLDVTSLRTGLYENQKPLIYPNPVNDILNIRGIQTSNIEIFDIQGRLIKIFEICGEPLAMDLRELQSGIYFIRFREGKEIKRLKFIKK